MVEVTEADRLAAAQLIENYWHGDPSKAGNGMRRLAQSYKDGHAQGVWVTAFATHRVEAAKAERDRLRNLPDDVMVEVMESFNNGLIKKADPTNPRGFVTYYDPLQASRNLVTALADALEGEHP